MKTKAKAVLGFSKLNPEGKVVRSQAIVDDMQASGNFPDATLPINYAGLQGLITNLHNAIVLAENGSSATTSRMHEEERKLMMAFNLIKMHVEMVSNATIDPESFILSSGMTLGANAGPNAVSDLSLEALGEGVIQIRVPRHAGDKAFCYQYALVSDRDNWQNIGFNSLSKIHYSGQVAGTLILVRYAPISKDGLGAFSSAKQIMVI
jgi:hypothetical protein